ncbi:hypothetical protein ACLOJK_014888 [Asimina triloba]
MVLPTCPRCWSLAKWGHWPRWNCLLPCDERLPLSGLLNWRDGFELHGPPVDDAMIDHYDERRICIGVYCLDKQCWSDGFFPCFPLMPCVDEEETPDAVDAWEEEALLIGKGRTVSAEGFHHRVAAIAQIWKATLRSRRRRIGEGSYCLRFSSAMSTEKMKTVYWPEGRCHD